MTEAILLGAAIVAGAPWGFVAILAAGVANPWIGVLALVVLLALRRERSRRWSVDVRFCRAVADELRGGASLRAALAVAAHEINEMVLARACRIGRSYDELATEAELCLPLVGSVAATAIRIAGESGGRAADSFEAIASLAADEEEMRNERRAATAQVRASAFVIAILPVLLLAGLAATGHLSVLAAGGSLTVGFLAAGFILIVTGLLSIWRMVRRAEPA